MLLIHNIIHLFEETVEAFAKGGYAGIGVGCFEALRLVDVDDCVVYGKLDTRGQGIVDTLDSYTELSPSGTGIHIFILADEFTYDSERYYMGQSSEWFYLWNDYTHKGSKEMFGILQSNDGYC